MQDTMGLMGTPSLCTFGSILHWVSDLQTGQRPCQNPDPPIRTNQVHSDELNQVRGTAARSPHWTRGPPGQL